MRFSTGSVSAAAAVAPWACGLAAAIVVPLPPRRNAARSRKFRSVRHRAAQRVLDRELETQAIQLGRENQRLERRLARMTDKLRECDRELAEARAHAVRIMETDQLTGLPNRTRFAKCLDTLIADAASEPTRFALILLDLDRFKEINGALGYDAGDALLRHLAIRLFFCAEQARLVARLGSDEFAILIPLSQDDSGLEDLANALLRTTSEPIRYRDRLLEISCSVGIARFPDDADTQVELQRRAGLALYRAKRTRSAFERYDSVMRQEDEARQILGAELPRAIRDGQIEAWFQPIYDHATGQIVAAETLARWRHPTRGVLAPAQFLDLVEERGLMHELFAQMLRSAAPVIRRWAGKGSLQSFSVNISPSQFASTNLAADIIALLQQLRIPASALTLEITEEIMLQDFDRVCASLKQMADHGVSIALDDFGVGYSNIGYLRQLPFHTLKVDRSLTVGVATERKVRAILGAIVTLARALDLTLIAEGVETKTQSDSLARLGFRRQQGYLYGRPAPAAAFDQVIAGPICRSVLRQVADRPHHLVAQ